MTIASVNASLSCIKTSYLLFLLIHEAVISVVINDIFPLADVQQHALHMRSLGTQTHPFIEQPSGTRPSKQVQVRQYTKL